MQDICNSEGLISFHVLWKICEPAPVIEIKAKVPGPGKNETNLSKFNMDVSPTSSPTSTVRGQIHSQDYNTALVTQARHK